ncbi:YggS family pyridoxal phosphate enzyme [Clostridia bacterium]|nr:YggS family pyridoxal phosphate enzyme [Clostridia bacterium]
MIRENARRIKATIPDGVTLVAASKNNPAAAIREAFKAGITVFGENRVQEMLAKIGEGAYDGAELHFIGRLQTNKVRQIVGKVALIQSVGSVKLAEEIDRCAAKLGLRQDVLLELNIGNEENKAGFDVENFTRNLGILTKLPCICIRGLMIIPPIVADPSDSGAYFKLARKIMVDNSSELCQNACSPILSMGMSGDYEKAIECGSTMVRVGTALFGNRE